MHSIIYSFYRISTGIFSNAKLILYEASELNTPAYIAMIPAEPILRVRISMIRVLKTANIYRSFHIEINNSSHVYVSQ